jgi:excisionase family DNA binding protein
MNHHPALASIPQSMISTPWLDSKEAAQYLKVEPRTLLQWAREGRVKGYVLSGTLRITWRFRVEDLDAAITELTNHAVLNFSTPSVAPNMRRIQ